MFYKSGIITAGEMVELLSQALQKAMALPENDILSYEIEINTTETCKQQVLSDQSDNLDRDLDFEELEKALDSVEPKKLHLYLAEAVEYARDCDYYWDRMWEAKMDDFRDNILPDVRSILKKSDGDETE